MIEKIKSVKEIIDSIGTRKEIAKIFGITVGAVDHWILMNRIAMKSRPKIIELAKDKNITLTMLDLTPYRKRKRVVQLSKKYQELIQNKPPNQGTMP